VAAAAAVPLAHLGNGWRTPLLVFGCVSLVLAATWYVLTRDEPAHVRVETRPLRLPLSSPLAWRLVAAFFFMSSVFYGLNSWLSDAYVERGWSQSCAVALGVAIGPLFPLTMTLPLDATTRPAEVASLAGMMLGVGYTLSATSPLILGAIRDLTGGFSAVLWTLVGLAAALVVVDASFSPERLGAARSSGERPPRAAST